MSTTQLTDKQIKDGDITDLDFATANKDGAVGVPSLRTLGTGALQAMPGNTPVGGNVTSSDGSIAVTLADLIINQNWANQNALINGRLSVSISGGATSALTIAVKTMDSTDPSSSNVVQASLRSSTINSGAFEILRITSALSITIPNGATMGFGANRAGRIWIVLFNNAGTPVLGVINCFLDAGTGGPGSVFSLREDNFLSTTAISGSSGLGHVMYTNGVALTNKPFRIIGYVEWQAGLATPGTWTPLPTKVQNFRYGVQLPGNIVQRISNYNGASNTGTGVIPFDATIPQSNEGNPFMTTTITPNSDANILQIFCLMTGTISTANFMMLSIIRNTQANAIVAVAYTPGSSSFMVQVSLEYSELSNNNGSPVTYTANLADNAAGTTYFNRIAASTGTFGGKLFSNLNVNEIMA